MSFNYNKVFIAGNLTRDINIRQMPNGTVIGEFGIASNRKFKGADGQTREEATFVDVTCFGKTAELVEKYLKKGSGCFVEGRLKLDQWNDKETQQKRTKLCVIADNIQFTGGMNDGGGGGGNNNVGQRGPSQPSASASVSDSDEPPF